MIAAIRDEKHKTSSCTLLPDAVEMNILEIENSIIDGNLAAATQSWPPEQQQTGVRFRLKSVTIQFYFM
jgi:hypothetical protein